jgi:uncharacterized phage protein gp47/JayE
MYTNSELIETILNDLNDYMKAQAHGQYVQASIIMSNVAQKLVNLQNGIDADMKNKDETIEKLKVELRKRGVDIIDVPAEELKGESNE